MSTTVDGPAAAPPAAGEVHVWQTLRLRSAAPADAWTLLTADERARAGSYRFAPDRALYVAARGWLRQVLASYLGMAPKDLRFTYGRRGKPELVGEAAGLAFNLSRRGDRALVAVARGHRVGIDLEEIRADFPFEGVAEATFSRREQARLARLKTAEARRRAFFLGWTRKEACVKATGDGLALPPAEVEVTFLPGEAPRLIGGRLDPGRWSLADVDGGPDHVAALAVEGPACRIVVIAAP